MAGVDVDVKDLMLLISYEGSFQSAMSSINSQFNFASMLLDNLVDTSRGITSRVRGIVNIRKQGLAHTQSRLVAATKQAPPNPNTIAIAAKHYEHCKEAYELAIKTEEQCEELVRQLIVRVELANEQIRKCQFDVRDKSSSAISYLGAYRTALNQYKDQNGS